MSAFSDPLCAYCYPGPESSSPYCQNCDSNQVETDCAVRVALEEILEQIGKLKERAERDMEGYAHNILDELSEYITSKI